MYSRPWLVKLNILEADSCHTRPYLPTYVRRDSCDAQDQCETLRNLVPSSHAVPKQITIKWWMWQIVCINGTIWCPPWTHTLWNVTLQLILLRGRVCFSTSLNVGSSCDQVGQQRGRSGIVQVAELGSKALHTSTLSQNLGMPGLACWRTSHLEQAELPQGFWSRCGKAQARSVESFSLTASLTTDCWLRGVPHSAQFRSAESPRQATDSWTALYYTPLRFYGCMLHSMAVAVDNWYNISAGSG